jgi:hypothetical protein
MSTSIVVALVPRWDGEEYPFYDQLLVSVGIGFSLSFSGFVKKTEPGSGKGTRASPK